MISKIVRLMRRWISDTVWKVGRKFLDYNNSKRLVNNDFTIISRNCVGGVIYHSLGKQFSSPTINLFMSQKDFIKFIKELEAYIKLEIKEDKNASQTLGYPVAKCGDLTIHFIHYKSFNEAKEKWDRRKKRINYKKIFLINTDQDDYSREIDNEYAKLPYPKILFVHSKKQVVAPYHVYIKGFDHKPYIGNILDRKNKFGRRYLDDFDYVSFINNL